MGVRTRPGMRVVAASVNGRTATKPTEPGIKPTAFLQRIAGASLCTS
jgi:hypothetical protein